MDDFDQSISTDEIVAWLDERVERLYRMAKQREWLTGIKDSRGVQMMEEEAFMLFMASKRLKGDPHITTCAD